MQKSKDSSNSEVFVVYGRNDRIREDFFAFLRTVRLHPVEWSEAVAATGKASPYVGEILEVAFARAGAIVVLFTPDDVACLQEQYRNDDDPSHETQPTAQARQNVLFEAGRTVR